MQAAGAGAGGGMSKLTPFNNITIYYLLARYNM